MELAVTTGQRTRRIQIVRQEGRLVVTVDGRARQVDVRPSGGGALSLLVTGPSGAARSVEASVATLGPGAYEVHLDGRLIAVTVRNGRGSPGRGAGSPGGGPLQVTAPMPGKIVRILVKPGDDVRARQGLIVVEAMKMENELRAARDGRVRRVAVEPGQSVEAGTVLVEVEPAPAGEPGP